MGGGPPLPTYCTFFFFALWYFVVVVVSLSLSLSLVLLVVENGAAGPSNGEKNN